MTSYRLSILSGWKLNCNGVEIPVRSKKGRALLTYLALGKRRAGREALAELLWDNDDAAKARMSLRQVVSGVNLALRDCTPPVFTSVGEEICLDRDAVTTDLDALMSDIDAGLAEEEAYRKLQSLPTAFAHFAGVSSGFDLWLDEIRSRVPAAAAARLHAVYTDSARPRDAISRAAHAALYLDDLDEAAARAVMFCHVAAGNAALALRVYGDLHNRLAAELDAEPSPETQDLVVAIKMGTVRGTPVHLPSADATGPASKVVTVAVLPFDVFGSGAAPEYLSLGLLDQITCQLAAYRAPAVISSNSTRGYHGRAPDIRQIRADLDPTYVVSGSVLLDGGEAMVAVQLVEAATSLVRWAGSFEVAVDRLFSVRAGVAENIARALLPNVDLAELRTVMSSPTSGLGPYHLVLRAKDLIFQLDRASFNTAGGLLSQAVATDPSFAPAHALFAEWYALRVWQGWSDQPAVDREALAAHVKRAVTLSPGDGRAIALMGHCQMMFEARHAQALTLLDQAIELCPNDADTLSWSIPTLSYCGQAQRAVALGKRAVSLSPLDPFIFRNEHFLSIAQFMAGQFDEAAENGLSCYRRVPDYSSNIRMTIAALSKAGRVDAAQELVARHAALIPDFSVGAFMQNHGLPDRQAREDFGRVLVAAGLPR